MKLEYLADGSPECPLIRLYEFTPSEAEQFFSLVAGLASGDCHRVEVHRLPYVEAIDGCKLALVCGAWEQAVIGSGRPTKFECTFTADTWDNVAGRIEPLSRISSGFQWIAGEPGEAAILMSASGRW